MDNEHRLKEVINDINKNRRELISEIVKVGIDKEEFNSYVSGEILLVNVSKKLQIWVKDNDSETYMLEMTRPSYVTDIMSEIFSMQEGTPKSLSMNTGVPKFHCLIVILSMEKQEMIDYRNSEFSITGKRTSTVHSGVQPEKKISAKKWGFLKEGTMSDEKYDIVVKLMGWRLFVLIALIFIVGALFGGLVEFIFDFSGNIGNP